MLAKPGVTGSLAVSEVADTAVFTGMTVGDIANAVRNIEPNGPALIERIRAWTKQKPEGEMEGTKTTAASEAF